MCHIRDTTRTPDVCLPSLERCGVSEGGAWHKGSGIGSASRSRTSHALAALCAPPWLRRGPHPSTRAPEHRGARSELGTRLPLLGLPFPPPAPLAFYRDFLQCMRCAADVVVTVAAVTYRAPG